MQGNVHYGDGLACSRAAVALHLSDAPLCLECMCVFALVDVDALFSVCE